MLKKMRNTLSIGLSGILALGIGFADAADNKLPCLPKNANQREANILHELVPHVVLPETIQYNKTVKSQPGARYTNVSPYVGTYVAYPSYQVPYSAVFRPIGQLVYPVSPQVPPPVLEDVNELALDEADIFETEAPTAFAFTTVGEPIRLASDEKEVIPALPKPYNTIVQTGIFCQQPAKPPAAWAFSSPLFKIASTPAGWGGQAGGIVHNSPRGSGQQVGFMPAGQPGMMPGMEMSDGNPYTNPYGVPYTTFQSGRGLGQNFGPQVQVLPNGMLLLTMPPTHHSCGLIRCRGGCSPRTVLLPPGPAQLPQMPQQMSQGMMPPVMQMPMQNPMQNPMQEAMMFNPMMQQAMMQNAMMQNAMMSGMSPYMMPVNHQPMIPQIMPQMQGTPMMVMTPMGPAMINPVQQMFPQMPMMNPMVMQQDQQVPMAMAMPNPMIAAQASGEGSEGVAENQMQVVATPFGYAIRVPTDSLQPDVASQLTQMQQMLLQQSGMMQPQMSMQPQMMPVQFQMPMNPYAGLYATPFGYMAMNQSAGQFGSLGQSSMFVPNQGGGMSVSDMMQIIAFINSTKPQRRMRLFERIAERREARRAGCNDPVTQMMQAWTTPYTSPDMTMQMPARNAYPYGYFGVQGAPISTANYGGYHNMYYGSTGYPGLY